VNEFDITLIAVSLLLFTLLGGLALYQNRKAERAEKELKRRDSQIEEWAFYFFNAHLEGSLSWPDVLQAIAQASPFAGAFLAWLSHQRRMRDAERLLWAAHRLASSSLPPHSSEGWRSLGASELGEEYFRAVLTDLALVLKKKSQEDVEWLDFGR
jgi:hypothetical protein